MLARLVQIAVADGILAGQLRLELLAGFLEFAGELSGHIEQPAAGKGADRLHHVVVSRQHQLRGENEAVATFSNGAFEVFIRA